VRRRRRLPLLLGLLVLASLMWLFRPMRISGPSMEPTLQEGDWVWTLPLWSAPRRGDLVIFDAPDGSPLSIKRVAGLPGEKPVRHSTTLQPEDGRPAIETSSLEWGSVGEGEQGLPAKHYFLLGDNPSNSVDSRQFGPVDLAQIRRRVIWLPGKRSEPVGGRVLDQGPGSGEE